MGDDKEESCSQSKDMTSEDSLSETWFPRLESGVNDPSEPRSENDKGNICVEPPGLTLCPINISVPSL